MKTKNRDTNLNLKFFSRICSFVCRLLMVFQKKNSARFFLKILMYPSIKERGEGLMKNRNQVTQIKLKTMTLIRFFFIDRFEIISFYAYPPFLLTNTV